MKTTKRNSAKSNEEITPNGVYFFFTYLDIINCSLKTKADKCDCFDAILNFARNGKVQEDLKPKVKRVFDIIYPLLSSRRKEDIKKMSGGKFENEEKKSAKRSSSSKKAGGGACKNSKRENPKALNGAVDNSFENEKVEDVGLYVVVNKPVGENNITNNNNNKIDKEQTMNNSKEREIKNKEKEKCKNALLFEREIPSEEDVKNFVLSNSLDVEAGIFYHFYAGKSWLINGNSFNWREKILEWQARGAGRKEKNLDCSRRKHFENERDFSGVNFDDVFNF